MTGPAVAPQASETVVNLIEARLVEAARTVARMQHPAVRLRTAAA